MMLAAEMVSPRALWAGIGKETLGMVSPEALKLNEEILRNAPKAVDMDLSHRSC